MIAHLEFVILVQFPVEHSVGAILKMMSTQHREGETVFLKVIILAKTVIFVHYEKDDI